MSHERSSKRLHRYADSGSCIMHAGCISFAPRARIKASPPPDEIGEIIYILAPQRLYKNDDNKSTIAQRNCNFELEILIEKQSRN